MVWNEPTATELFPPGHRSHHAPPRRPPRAWHLTHRLPRATGFDRILAYVDRADNGGTIETFHLPGQRAGVESVFDSNWDVNRMPPGMITATRELRDLNDGFAAARGRTHRRITTHDPHRAAALGDSDQRSGRGHAFAHPSVALTVVADDIHRMRTFFTADVQGADDAAKSKTRARRRKDANGSPLRPRQLATIGPPQDDATRANTGGRHRISPIPASSERYPEYRNLSLRSHRGHAKGPGPTGPGPSRLGCGGRI